MMMRTTSPSPAPFIYYPAVPPRTVLSRAEVASFPAEKRKQFVNETCLLAITGNFPEYMLEHNRIHGRYRRLLETLHKESQQMLAQVAPALPDPGMEKCKALLDQFQEKHFRKAKSRLTMINFLMAKLDDQFKIDLWPENLSYLNRQRADGYRKIIDLLNALFEYTSRKDGLFPGHFWGANHMAAGWEKIAGEIIA